MSPRRHGQSAVRGIAPLFTLALVLCVWQAAIEIGKIPSTILPKPFATIQGLFNWFYSGDIYPHLWATVKVAIGGYILGAILAVSLAAVMALYKPAYRHLIVLLMTVQAIPKIALAPLFFMWLGFGSMTGISLVMLACFYPMFVNSLTGFRNADPNLINLYRTFDASKLKIFFAVSFPSALPHIFVGLEISVVFALIAAVVMEFIASARGLGFLIQDAATTLNTETVFSSVAILAIGGIILSSLVRRLRRHVVFWDASSKSPADHQQVNIQ